MCDYSRFYGGWEDVGEGKMVGEGIGVLAGLSHAIHLAGGMLCIAFFVMDAKL